MKVAMELSSGYLILTLGARQPFGSFLVVGTHLI
jgi:hypothetical protein